MARTAPSRILLNLMLDAALASAGLPILHVVCQRRYDPTTLIQRITAALAPAPQRGAPALRPRPGLVREAPAVALTPAQALVRWSCR